MLLLSTLLKEIDESCLVPQVCTHLFSLSLTSPSLCMCVCMCVCTRVCMHTCACLHVVAHQHMQVHLLVSHVPNPFV